jgi:nucleoside-diphosphate-sugar epimerase
VEGSVCDRHQCLVATEGVSSVIHLAGLVHRPNESLETFRLANVTGTQTILESAKTNGVERFVFASSAGVYGPESAVAYPETGRLQPTSRYGISKLEAERKCLAAGDTIQISIARISAVIGPGMDGSYARMMRAIDKGYFIRISKGLNQRSLIYVKDAAQLLSELASSETPHPGVFNISSPTTYSVNEIVQAAAKALDRRLPPTIPARPVLAVCHLADAIGSKIRRSVGPGESYVDIYQRMTGNAVLDVNKMLNEMTLPRWTSLQQAWLETVEGMRASKTSS